MINLIEHVENESLSKFKESAYESLNSKMQLALENEKINTSLDYFAEDVDDYEESDPHMDVDIDPEEFNESDMVELEKIIWDDPDFDEDEAELDEELELTYEQLVFALENFEELDELSKKTLGSYTKKVRMQAYEKGVPLKRMKSYKTAEKKLTKEEVEYLDELSKKTLGSYVKKASNDMAVKHGEHQTKKAEAEEVDRFTNRNMKDKFDARDKMKKSIDADDESLSKIRRKVGNRSKGIDRAADKLSKD